MSLGIYLIPFFVLGSIYLFRSIKDLIKEKNKTSKFLDNQKIKNELSSKNY